MKKLTLLTSEFPPFRGGVGVLADQLAAAATQLGASVEVIAPDYKNSALKDQDAALSYQVKRYRAGPYDGKRIPLYLVQAMKAARDEDAGRLVAVDSPFLEALALTQRLHGKPFDAILHGSEITRASRSRLRKLIGIQRVFSAPDRYFANSDFTRNLLLQNMPFVEPARVVTTYPAANAKWFSKPDMSACDGVAPLDTERLVVCTGRITPRKGQTTLLKALHSAPMDAGLRKGLTVVIAGRAANADRAYLADLEKQADLIKPIRVIIRGDLDDECLRALYAKADLFCLPGSAKTTAVEGFGLVFIEAAAQGLPSVAGAVGAVPETVRDSETGVLVPPDDPVALGQALAALLADQPRIDAMKTAARKHAGQFSWTAFAKPFLDAV